MPSATVRTRGLPLTRRLLCLLSYEGDGDPLRLCPNASIPSDVVSRCTWPGQGSRTSRTANTMSRGHGVKGHTRSGADDESRTRGLDHGVVALCLLSYIRKGCEEIHRPVPRSPRSKLLKSVHRRRWCDPSIAGLRRCAGRLKSEMKKARILSESGPLRTELGGCASTRCPLPDAFGPRSDQAASRQWMARIGSSSDRPGARRRRKRPATPPPRRARTRPDPSWVGWFLWRAWFSR